MTSLHHVLSNPFIFEISLLMIAICAGIFGALLGLGGGVLIVPALTLLFGINIRYAVGASIVSVIATSSGAAATYVRDHITNIRVAMLLEVATTCGALGGAIVSPFIPVRALFFIFALILMYSSFLMFRRRHHGDVVTVTKDWFALKLRLNSHYPDKILGKNIFYAVTRVPLGFAIMFCAGIISGLLGLGGGVLKVAAMDTAMHLPIKVSSATSNFMIGVTAAAGAGAYYMRGDIVPALAAPVAIGVLGGSMLGTRLMTALPAARLRKLFLTVLVLIAIQMALRAFGVGA